ncbi:sll1489 [Synechocystis sp. PCC 6803]|uniref:Sll1489 protein n=2 Tax=Synechocystis TaxID=1142 RepID=P74601_SYNY3|nr:hypothetical protein MYO_130400 [Synechocystis sp. PCC 6803]BAL30751.1 hypothetical protein SYNGTI_3004 [Synechocystis sp. PCC 6803 substr. GT-I]BAL33920.1 hypothetical protein SYNPCCN_3003 [Synechocystis sp. PCC 6803 substr. PCC-N]BAL37089.1 hypothetical protein SYNPCCP_3003 [Synechocystis sp. PCC 6803 substr. PCC-P]BAM53425.1 hypothetical protein BEST7613_4494 [Synechocystis sp. PCC 6803] [Bacillus subtilis BEST7613]
MVSGPVFQFSAPMTPDSLQQLLTAIASGHISSQEGFEQLKHLSFQAIDDFAKVDHQRQLRTGFPEVVWGPGKTPEQIEQIIQVLAVHNPVVLVTRVEPEVADLLGDRIPLLQYYPQARICALVQTPLQIKYSGTIGVLSAGTADLPVAEEAAITASLCGFKVEKLWDVGVAGIHRLLSHRELIQAMDVLIVVAGMEGALPSVVAGLVDCPVIGVPTSVGYGTSFGGVAPLLTMLNSCAVGVGVVNIDNGFGAAMLAGQILRTVDRLQSKSTMANGGQGG